MEAAEEKYEIQEVPESLAGETGGPIYVQTSLNSSVFSCVTQTNWLASNKVTPKRDLSRKEKLSGHCSIFVPTLTCAHRSGF